MSKKELIDAQVIEKTSGIEIINRLVKNGFVNQFPDENDKRSKLLARISTYALLEPSVNETK